MRGRGKTDGGRGVPKTTQFRMCSIVSGTFCATFLFPLLTSNEIDAIVFVFLRVMRTC